MCAFSGWLVDLGYESFWKKKNSTVWPFKVVLIGGWLVDLWFLEEKIRLCGRHLACWLVDLVVRGKNFQTVVAFRQLTYLFAASWNMCVRFFWLTGWLWILSKMTKLRTAWFTSFLSGPPVYGVLQGIPISTHPPGVEKSSFNTICGSGSWWSTPPSFNPHPP